VIILRPDVRWGEEYTWAGAQVVTLTDSPATVDVIARAAIRARTRQAQKSASWVEAGPGSRLHGGDRVLDSRASSQPRGSTHRARSRAMWAGGPPNPDAADPVPLRKRR
jgi:hypothetical protein